MPVYITNIHTRQASYPLTRLPGPTTAALHPFAADPASAVRQLSVHVTRPQPARLVLEYDLQGALAQMSIPAAAGGTTEGHTDGLWRHTCMEAFVRAAPRGPYLEFNLAPSGQWAAYRFSGYREAMAPLTAIRRPHIELRTQPHALLLRADIALPPELADAGLQLAIAAVVENAQGQLTYWALRHGGERPDFHRPDGFELKI